MPTEHLDTLDKKFKASLQKIADEGIDMKRMAMVINRDERQVCFYITALLNELILTTITAAQQSGGLKGRCLPKYCNH